MSDASAATRYDRIKTLAGTIAFVQHPLGAWVLTRTAKAGFDFEPVVIPPPPPPPGYNVALPAVPAGYAEGFFSDFRAGLAGFSKWGGSPGSSPASTIWDGAMVTTGLNGANIHAEPDAATNGVKTRTGGFGRDGLLSGSYRVQIACKRPNIHNLKRNGLIGWPEGPGSPGWPGGDEDDACEDGGDTSGFDINWHSNVPSFNSVIHAHAGVPDTAPVDTSVWGYFDHIVTPALVSTTWVPNVGEPVTISIEPGAAFSNTPHGFDTQIEALVTNLGVTADFEYDWYRELTPA